VTAPKIDHDQAFHRYVAMGAQRSLRILATEIGCSKRSIQKISERHHWQERLRVIEGEVRERVRQEVTDSLTEVAQRHLKMARAIQSRGVQALQKLEYESAWHASKAIELGAKLERLVLGESTERTADSVQATTRHEVETLLTTETEPEEPDAEEDGEAG
jgi:hypothetical protein